MPIDSRSAPRVAVVGSTGVVGGTLLELLEEQLLRYRELHLIASHRSARRQISVGSRTYRVQDLERFDFGEVDLALFFAGAAISAAWAPVAVSHGALVIDISTAFREDSDTPLVVPQVNAEALDRRPLSGVIASPACSTIVLTQVLHAIDKRWGVRRAVVSTYQAAVERGHSGIEELLEGSQLALQDPDAELPRGVFDPPLAFNVVPVTGRVLDSGLAVEELGLLRESRRILRKPDLEVMATCVRVPVVDVSCQALWVECDEPVARDEVGALLAREPVLKVHDVEAPGDIPTPMTAGDPDRVHISRLRVSPDDPRGLGAWVVADPLRVGAALNVCGIVDELHRRRVL